MRKKVISLNSWAIPGVVTAKTAEEAVLLLEAARKGR
jgi:hypothetical protein